MLYVVDGVLISPLFQFYTLYSCALFGSLSALEDRYTRSIPDFTVTIPRKVSEEGTFISHYLPHFYNARRKKRDLSGEVVSYIIPLEGQDHLVHLWPNTDFLSPGLVVEHHSLADNNRSRIKVRKARDTQCHYSGVISGIDDSRVALSTCYGLAGHIVTPDDEFFIEPSLDENRSGEYHKHYIYKREALKNHANGTTTNCGTQGTLRDALKERMEWEIKYGKELEKSITSPLLEDISYTPELNLIPIKGSRTKRSCVRPSTTCCPVQRNVCLAKPGHFVEVMVTVDARLEKQFLFDLETYIFTIFNMVARNFFLSSIGETINLQLVRVLYLSYTLPRLDVSRFSPSKLLDNFCDWQLEMNPLLESHPNHHDIGVFITRFEPCQGNILGLTHMASVCRLDKSCVVASEEGLLLANIITHQIGHSVGAEHDDGDVGGCVGEDLDGTIYHMNPKISTASTAWSVCSKHSIGTFIKSRMSWCLSDTARDHEFKSPDILAGQVYDAIQQCSLNYKMKTLACGTEDFCKVLYCQISPNKCATTGDPPAPGTPCAKGMWCFHGDCVQQGQRPGTIDGNWSPWSSWTPCTRTCGGGVQTRYRLCNNPAPSRGGRFCFGERITHRMCLTWPCPGYSPTFQDIQCKATNKRPFRGHYFLWDHFQAFFDDMPCTLVCINEIHEVTVRAPIVINGTPCKPGTKNVCIEGICREVGCDYVIDSNSKSDMCGLCHGPGTGCRIVQGIFDEPDVEGMETVLKLPEGTGMIFIRELDASACYAIISSGYNNTNFLNSPAACDHLPGEFSISGVSGVYDDANDLERIFIREPIKTPIIFSIKCPNKGDNQGWRYQYALPEEPSVCYIPSYKWEYLRWDTCSRECGGGVQRARPSCVEAKGGEVEEKFCYNLDKPVVLMRTCNSKPCVAKWWVGPWFDCDCSDGEGIMTRLVFCMKPQEEDFALAKIVRDKECSYQPKPKTQRPCSPEKNMKLFALERLERFKREPSSFEEGPSKENLAAANLQRESNEPTSLDYSISNEADVATEEISAAVDENLQTTLSSKKNVSRRHVRKGHTHHLKNPKKSLTSVISLEKEGDGMSLDKESISSIEERIVGFPNDKINEDSELVSNVKVNETPQQAENTTGNLVTLAVCESSPYVYQKSTQTTDECRKTDFFLDQVFPQRKSTTCSVNESGYEPADLGPELEYGNKSVYKLFIVPIKSVPGIVSETDIGLSYFGKSVYFPPCTHKNKTFVSGDSIFRILQEARKRATTPPYFEVDEK